MQLFRDLTWWLIGLITLITFTLVLILSNVLYGQFRDVPSAAIVVVYLGLLFGFLNKFRIFQLGDTLVHEIGHAQMSALSLGKVSYIRVERDTSGVTSHRLGGIFKRLSIALISICGPLSSSIIFVITARLVASELTAYWALGLGVFIILILITTVRNLWGWITGISLLAILYLIIESSGLIVPKLLSTTDLTRSNDILVSGLLGVVSWNLGTALRYSVRNREVKSPSSDEYKFCKALFIPTFLGGRLILLIEIALMWIGLSYLLGWSGIFQIGRLI